MRKEFSIKDFAMLLGKKLDDYEIKTPYDNVPIINKNKKISVTIFKNGIDIRDDYTLLKKQIDILDYDMRIDFIRVDSEKYNLNEIITKVYINEDDIKEIIKDIKLKAMELMLE